MQPFAPANTTGPARRDENYLFDALIAGIVQLLQWHLIITIGQANDPTNDATIPWPDAREQVDAGTLTLDHVGSEDTSPTSISIRWFCRKEWRRPMILYLTLVQRSIPVVHPTRRREELPSVVTPSEVRK